MKELPTNIKFVAFSEQGHYFHFVSIIDAKASGHITRYLFHEINHIPKILSTTNPYNSGLICIPHLTIKAVSFACRQLFLLLSRGRADHFRERVARESVACLHLTQWPPSRDGVQAHAVGVWSWYTAWACQSNRISPWKLCGCNGLPKVQQAKNHTSIFYFK